MSDANERVERRETSGLAIASLALSCLSGIIGPFGFIPGIICGRIARRSIQRNPNQAGAGIALAGLIVGYFFLTLYTLAIVLVIGWEMTNLPS